MFMHFIFSSGQGDQGEKRFPGRRGKFIEQTDEGYTFWGESVHECIADSAWTGLLLSKKIQ